LSYALDREEMVAGITRIAKCLAGATKA
jgi:hypothetical protein